MAAPLDWSCLRLPDQTYESIMKSDSSTCYSSPEAETGRDKTVHGGNAFASLGLRQPAAHHAQAAAHHDAMTSMGTMVPPPGAAYAAWSVPPGQSSSLCGSLLPALPEEGRIDSITDSMQDIKLNPWGREVRATPRTRTSGSIRAAALAPFDHPPDVCHSS